MRFLCLLFVCATAGAWTATEKIPSVEQIVSGGAFHCARFDDGRAKCWGYGGTGQLGVGNSLSYGKFAAPLGREHPFVDLGGAFVEELSAGEVHVCARLRGRKPKCWGNNEKRQLGHPGENLGASPGDMGENLPEVELIDETPFVQLASGDYFTCGLHTSGKVECWGSNWNGDSSNRPGIGKDVSPATGPVEKHAIANFGDGKIAGLGAGSDFVCARFVKGHVRCIGINYAGQLGIGNEEPRNANLSENVNLFGKVIGLAGGMEHMCALLEGGSLKCWGGNSDGELGVGDTQPRGMTLESLETGLNAVDLGHGLSVKAVAARFRRTCALLSNYAVKCWGQTAEEGEVFSVGTKPGHMGDNLKYYGFGRRERALELSMSNGSVCAKLPGSRVKCMGSNTDGQLGINSDLSSTRRGILPETYPPVLLF